ncbi:MAG: hypothetical protein R3A52_23975 [Polyangiales bacterium]
MIPGIRWSRLALALALRSVAVSFLSASCSNEPPRRRRLSTRA